MQINNIRQASMKEYITLHKHVSIKELMEEFHVSDMTVRRDLDNLQRLGFIKRVHGGAIAVGFDGEDIPINMRIDSGRALKERIATAAVAYIEEGDSVFLDAGSTTLVIARKLLTRKNLVIITNGINIASMLSNNENIDIIMTGGEVRHHTQSLVGPFAHELLGRFHVRHAFIGCVGISVKHGFVNSNLPEGEVKRKIIENAENVYVVADHTKFEQTSFHTFAPIEAADIIITTKELNKAYHQAFTSLIRPRLQLV